MTKSATHKAWWASLSEKDRKEFIARYTAAARAGLRFTRNPGSSTEADMQLYELCCAEWAAAGHPIIRSD